MALRRKLTFRFGTRKIVFVKHRDESEEHVIGKAVLFALYYQDYPDLSVEVPAANRYKPDLVSFGDDGRPRFWAESGKVGRRKAADLLKKLPDTHLVFLRHSFKIDAFVQLLEKISDSAGMNRSMPVEVIGRPRDIQPYISKKGEIRISRSDCRIVTL